MSQEEVRKEFTEDIEREQVQSVWETQKEKEKVLSFTGVWGFYQGLWSSAGVFSGIWELVEQRQLLRCPP